VISRVFLWQVLNDILQPMILSTLSCICCRYHRVQAPLRQLVHWYRNRSRWSKCQLWTKTRTRLTKLSSRWAEMNWCRPWSVLDLSCCFV